MSLKDRTQLEAALHSALEELSAVEHERWSHWQRYLHSKGVKTADGDLILPANLVARWERQFATPYADLTDEEKESDREQVRKFLQSVVEALAS